MIACGVLIMVTNIVRYIRFSLSLKDVLTGGKGYVSILKITALILLIFFLGVKFMAPMHSFENIMPWILYHHERIDGKGYYGLSAEQIPLPAKIISICDTYSAITMRRSYKEPMSHETAMKIINEVAGSQLDAQLVKIFNTIPKEKLLACAPETIFA